MGGGGGLNDYRIMMMGGNTPDGEIIVFKKTENKLLTLNFVMLDPQF